LEETRNNFGVVRRAKFWPIDDGMSCLILDGCQMDVSIVDRHQPATILGADRVWHLDYHL
jgi:hypothetical protein